MEEIDMANTTVIGGWGGNSIEGWDDIEGHGGLR